MALERRVLGRTGMEAATPRVGTTPTTSPWRTLEISLESDFEQPNPYLANVNVRFLGPGGRVIERPAFWDGGRTWRVRFAPTAVGTWTWISSSTGQLISGLDGASGTIECVERPENLPIYTHGFIAAGAHHLTYPDGTPFFWLGDTHWRFLWESWSDANKEGWNSQFRGTVDLRVTQGFTVYQSNLMSWTHDWEAPGLWDEATGVVRPEFFRDVVDPRMAYIADAGLVHALGIAWFAAIRQDGDIERYARLARYLVARYGSYPMVWTLAGEVAGYEPSLRTFLIDAWRQVALAIEDANAGGYRQPQTAHLTAERPIPQYYQGEPWLVLTLNQHGHGDMDMGAHHYEEHLAQYPNTPVVEGESMYEGLTTVESVGRRTADATIVRQVAYRAMQSGCCGYTYGAQGCWNNAREYGDAAEYWGDLPWYLGIDLPGAQQMGHLRRFYEAHNWSNLRPAPDAYASSSWFNTVTYRPLPTANADRRTVVIFFGETYRGNEGGARLCGLSGDAYTLRWFDPRVGAYTMIAEAVTPVDGDVAIPDKPDHQDWLLVAEAVEHDSASSTNGS